MASSGKKKTTMAKLNRETRLRERRAIKEASKEARKAGTPRAADGRRAVRLAPVDPQPAERLAAVCSGTSRRRRHARGRRPCALSPPASWRRVR